MRKLLGVVFIGMSVAGSFAMAACVGDEPAAITSGGAAQGALGGACFANGTCSTGLSCNVIDGAAKCSTTSGATTSGGPTEDASMVQPPTNGSDGGTSAEAGCKFQTTSFPCGDPMPPTACYGATQGCTLTGCNPSEIRWECNSPRQCGTACCVGTDAATLAAGAGCTQGTLLITEGAASGATCSATTTCAAGATQLCQANADCPKGLRCVPVKIIGPVTALSGTIVAACAP